jgi:acid phosphatase
MKKYIASLFVSVFALSASIAFAEPPNLEIAKQQVMRYHDSGQYEKDITNVINSAMRYLKIALAHSNDNKKPAMILDIDETALSNYPDMIKMHFGGTFKQMQEAAAQGIDPAIKPTLELYKFAKAHNVAVFFITGRKEMERNATAANLEKVGYTGWDGLILRSKEYEQAPAATYKSAMRKQITDQGYDIIINVGDQKSDLAGPYTGKNFKLPDPFYYIP